MMQQFGEPSSFRVGDVYCKYFFFDVSKPVVVSFSHLTSGIAAELIPTNPSPWGFDFLTARNLNVVSISLIAGKYSFYRDMGLIQALPLIADALKVFPERLGYGSSAGAYAISAFSNILNLDRILLLCPISTLKREINSWDLAAKRFVPCYNYDWDSAYADGADTRSKGYVIYDPLYRVDRLHAERYTTLEKLKLPGTGHLIPDRLQRLGMLAWTVDTFLSGGIPDEEFYVRGRARRNLVDYYVWMLSNEGGRLSASRARTISASMPDELKKVYYNAQLSKFSATLKPNYEPADLLRDIALVFEGGGDRHTALMLMEKAHHLRPAGPFIREKYESLKGSKRLASDK